MKRYNLAWIEGVPQCLEHGDGEWVKYEDMKKEMARIWKDIQPPPAELLKP